MVIVWILMLPHAAARFEHEILLPRFTHLPPGGIFFVASAAAVMELTGAALLARMCAAIMRESARRLIHGYGSRVSARETSVTERRHAAGRDALESEVDNQTRSTWQLSWRIAQ